MLDFRKIEKYNFINILPISLIIGVLYQLISLGSLGFIQFFSWFQVINDTAIFFIPTLIGFLSGYIFVITSKKMIINVYESKYRFFIILSLIFLIYFLPKIIFIGFLNNLLSYIMLFNLVNIPFGIIIGSYIYSLKNNIKNHLDIYEFLDKIILLAMFIILGISFIFSGVNSSLYGKIYLINGGKEVKINYMNDKYIFLDNHKVIYNNNNIEFIIKDN